MKFSHVRPDPYSGLKTGLFCFVYLLVIVVCLLLVFKTLKIARVSSTGFIEGFYNKGKPYFTYVSAISVSGYLILEWTCSKLLNAPEMFTQVVFFYFGMNFRLIITGEVVV